MKKKKIFMWKIYGKWNIEEWRRKKYYFNINYVINCKK